jgi:glycosyltransferase involved in cell wall biosynthesis
LTKIVHLTSVHPPFDVRIFHKECVSLASAGYDVVLIAHHDEDAHGQGVRVHAVPGAQSKVERVTRTIGHVLRAALKEDADIYHFHDPELIPVGLLIKLLGKRVIYDVHENVPEDILTKEYIPFWGRSLVAGAMGKLERFASEFFDGIVAATPTIGSRFPPGRTLLICNYPSLQEWVCEDPRPYADRPPHVIYAGRISKDRGIMAMVQAMGILPEPLEARLVLAGLFDSPTLRTQVQQIKGWELTDYQGWLSRAELRRAVFDARIGLVLLHPCLSYLRSYPIKLFEYMAAGIPVIASNFPLWRDIVEGAGCGLLVDPLDVQGVADAIRWLLEHPEESSAMGQKGRDAVRSNYNWADEANKLCRFYRRLLGG